MNATQNSIVAKWNTTFGKQSNKGAGGKTATLTVMMGKYDGNNTGVCQERHGL
jgi:hypothetical protein